MEDSESSRLTRPLPKLIYAASNSQEGEVLGSADLSAMSTDAVFTGCGGLFSGAAFKAPFVLVCFLLL